MIFQDRLLLVFGRVDVGTAGKLNKKTRFLEGNSWTLRVFGNGFCHKKNIVERWSTNKTPSWKSCGKIQVQTPLPNGRVFHESFIGGPKLVPLNIQPYGCAHFESHTSTDHPVIMSNSTVTGKRTNISKLKIHGRKMFFLLK